MVGKWSTLCFWLGFKGLNGLTGFDPVSCGKDVPALEFWKQRMVWKVCEPHPVGEW